MLLNLSDVFTAEGMTEKKAVVLEMTSFDNGLESYQLVEPHPIELEIANAGEQKARIKGCTEITFLAKCDRCMEETPITLRISFNRLVFSPTAITDEDEEAEDIHYMDGYQLDVETFMYHEILENWPVKILCKEDCKGICPVCGQNLNEKECGCDTFVPDPRMAVIKDIYGANKEV